MCAPFKIIFYVLCASFSFSSFCSQKNLVSHVNFFQKEIRFLDEKRKYKSTTKKCQFFQLKKQKQNKQKKWACLIS
jgi:hypothetical protein